MKLSIQRDQLLKPLTYIAGVVERRQTLPILSNAYLRLEGDQLSITGTDLEVEVITRTDGVAGTEGEVTVGARKLLDICRALPEGSDLKLALDGEKVVIQSGRSRFSLQTLPSSDFPKLEAEDWETEFTVGQGELKRLFERTAFSMAQQDVRYYLNGLLLDLGGARIRAVATDGHRLARSEINIEEPVKGTRQVIVPRKAVMELARFLEDSQAQVNVALNPNHIRVSLPNVVFTSKLIDGRYPDYEKVIPSNMPTRLLVDHEEFRDTLGRAAILTNDKFRGVRLSVAPGRLMVTAHNPEQEEACDEMPIEYDGGEFDIGFNVTYLIEAVNALRGEVVEFRLKDQGSSCVLVDPDDASTLYLVMPMRL
jgi:DNA polymerase-3 subunit beta